jgi:hypothetical protein
MDGVKNGAETDVDCGGGACGPCMDMAGCAAGSDCVSGVCSNGQCAAASCMDGVKNGTETDIDCGGGACGPCADGQMCGASGDCASGVCNGGVCAMPTCMDGVKNGAETDVDCGGGTCGPCANMAACMTGSDCQSKVCVNGQCAMATCMDGVKNGAETGVDCGGGTCASCGNGQGCNAAADCLSGVCQNGTCAGCGSSADCGNGQVCLAGTCKPGCTSGTWLDLSGNGHDGTLKNFNNNATSGWVGAGTPADPYALRFDGTNDFVDLAPAADGLRLKDSLTLEAWVAPQTPNPTYNTLYSNRDGISDYSGSNFSWGSNAYWTVYTSTNGVNWQALSSMAAGVAAKWVHVVYSYSKAANASRLYVNGVQQSQGGAPASILYSAASVPRLGEKAGAFPFPGRLGIFRIWSVALTPQEITALFQKDAPRFNINAPLPLMNVNQPLALYLDAGKCGP